MHLALPAKLASRLSSRARALTVGVIAALSPIPLCPILLSPVLANPAIAQERIPSHCFALANAPDRLQWASFTDALADDHVRLQFLDHASFAIRAGDVTAVTDFTGWTGARDWRPDVVTMNNAHRSHWTAQPDPRIPHVLQGWDAGQGAPTHALDLGAMLVRNVSTDLRSGSQGGIRRNGNSIFVFEAAGLCIGHLGHLHHPPDPAQYASIGRLDVVMVPVDGGLTMPTKDMAEVVLRLRASVVLPMHWFSGASLGGFLADMSGQFDVVETEMSSIDLSLENLPGRPSILVLQPQGID